MKRKIYKAQILATYRKNFINENLRFNNQYLTDVKDLDSKAVIDNKCLTLIGMNDDKELVLIDDATSYIYVTTDHLFKSNQLVILERTPLAQSVIDRKYTNINGKISVA